MFNPVDKLRLVETRACLHMNHDDEDDGMMSILGDDVRGPLMTSRCLALGLKC